MSEDPRSNTLSRYLPSCPFNSPSSVFIGGYLWLNLWRSPDSIAFTGTPRSETEFSLAMKWLAPIIQLYGRVLSRVRVELSVVIAIRVMSLSEFPKRRGGMNPP
jgi:hypothetical protein